MGTVLLSQNELATGQAEGEGGDKKTNVLVPCSHCTMPNTLPSTLPANLERGLLTGGKGLGARLM